MSLSAIIGRKSSESNVSSSQAIDTSTIQLQSISKNQTGLNPSASRLVILKNVLLTAATFGLLNIFSQDESL